MESGSKDAGLGVEDGGVGTAPVEAEEAGVVEGCCWIGYVVVLFSHWRQGGECVCLRG